MQLNCGSVYSVHEDCDNRFPFELTTSWDKIENIPCKQYYQPMCMFLVPLFSLALTHTQPSAPIRLTQWYKRHPSTVLLSQWDMMVVVFDSCTMLYHLTVTTTEPKWDNEKRRENKTHNRWDREHYDLCCRQQSIENTAKMKYNIQVAN